MSPPKSPLQGRGTQKVFPALFLLGGLKSFNLTEVLGLSLCGNGSACREMGSLATCGWSEWSSSGLSLITSYYQNLVFSFLLEKKPGFADLSLTGTGL